MKRERIEPTLDGNTFDKDFYRSPGAVEPTEQPSARRSWIGGLLLLAILLTLFVVAVGLASQRGMSIPTPGELEGLARLLVLGGGFVMVGSQWAGAALLIRHNLVHALLSWLIPLYLFIALRRTGLLVPVAGVWLLGAAGLLTGTVLLS